MNLAAKLPSHQALLRLLAVVAAPSLSGCFDQAAIERNTVTIEGTFEDADGTRKDVLIQDQQDALYLAEELDASFWIPTLDGGDFLYTLHGQLPSGDHDGEEVPLRMCRCRQTDVNEIIEWGAYCDDDQENVCADIVARVTGTVSREECNPKTCLDQVSATFEIDGVGFTGKVTFDHAETWEMRDYHL